mmetsp:Transcript_6197/g.23423  ORF Transcript_6197/g.23423 Transcript_6197/m.23423 type:complete len:291 (-) Transcript_6197:66-938(-)
MIQHGLCQVICVTDPRVIAVTVCKHVREAVLVQHLLHGGTHPTMRCAEPASCRHLTGSICIKARCAFLAKNRSTQAIADTFRLQQCSLECILALPGIRPVGRAMVGHLVSISQQVMHQLFVAGNVVRATKEGRLCVELAQQFLNFRHHAKVSVSPPARGIVQGQCKKALDARVLGPIVEAQRPREDRAQKAAAADGVHRRPARLVEFGFQRCCLWKPSLATGTAQLHVAAGLGRRQQSRHVSASGTVQPRGPLPSHTTARGVRVPVVAGEAILSVCRDRHRHRAPPKRAV